MVLPVWLIDNLASEGSLAVVPQSLDHINLRVVCCVEHKYKAKCLRVLFHFLVVVHVQVVEEDVGRRCWTLLSQLIQELLELVYLDRLVVSNDCLDVSLLVDAGYNGHALESHRVGRERGRRFTSSPPSSCAYLVRSETRFINKDNWLLS